MFLYAKGTTKVQRNADRLLQQSPNQIKTKRSEPCTVQNSDRWSCLIQFLSDFWGAFHIVAGLFFCLASVEDAGLLFCPATIQPHASVYSAFCIVNAVIPQKPQNSAQGFTGAFPAIRRILPLLCDGASGYTAMMRHAGAHHRAAAPPPLPDTSATPDAAQVSTDALL